MCHRAMQKKIPPLTVPFRQVLQQADFLCCVGRGAISEPWTWTLELVPVGFNGPLIWRGSTGPVPRDPRPESMCRACSSMDDWIPASRPEPLQLHNPQHTTAHPQTTQHSSCTRHLPSPATQPQGPSKGGGGYPRRWGEGGPACAHIGSAHYADPDGVHPLLCHKILGLNLSLCILILPHWTLFLPRGALVGQFGPQNGAQGLRDGRRWGPVAVSWDGIHSGNVWGGFYSCFTRFYPVNGVVSSGPKPAPKRPQMAPNRAQWPRDMHPRGPVAVSGDGVHLGIVRPAFWSCFACFSPVNGVIWPQNSHTTAPNGPKMGPKWVRKRPKISKIDPRPFGVLKDNFSGRFEALFGPKRPSNGPFWDRKGVKNGQSPVFSKLTLDHLGCSSTPSQPVLRLFGPKTP